MSVAIVTMTKNPVNLKYWLDYHVRKGVSKFYVRLEVDGPEDEAAATPLLDSYGKKVLYYVYGRTTDKPAREDDSRVPGQAQMLRQRTWVTEAIRMSLDDGIKWLVHIDTDELLDCDGTVGRAIERDVKGDDNVQTLVLPNLEAVYEGTSASSCFEKRMTRDCNTESCASYANGKGAGRVTARLQEHGVHRFNAPEDRFQKELTLKSLRVIHFESCDFNAYMKKFMSLADTEVVDFPFPYYNDSINVARGKECNGNPESAECVREFEEVYRKYRVL
jgi:hypothetical protein